MTPRSHPTRSRLPRLRVTMLALALAFALASLAPASLLAQKHFPPDADLQLMLRYLVEDGETPGIVIGVLAADGSTRVLSYGSAGPDTRPLGARSVFEIGSINKTFTGTLLADMVARGEVALEDPISKYLPEGVTAPSRNGREITLLDLATHHSGLPRLPDNHTPANMQDPYADYTIEKLYEFLSQHELRRDVGVQFEYSNLGMGLLGHLLARAAGTSYRELLRERILEPLGMSMTAYALEGELGAWMTKGHSGRGEVVPFWFATEAIEGAGGLRSSVGDMLAYLKANIGPADTDLERAMRVAHELRLQINEQQAIGLAWQLLSYEGRTLVTHGGGTGGFSTMIGFDPEQRVGFARLTNTTEFDDDVGLDFLRRGPPLAIPEVDVAPETLARYAGVYQAAPGRVVVRLEPEGWLTMQAPENVRFRMYAESDTSFFVKRTPWRFWFTKNEAGEVTGVVADLEGDRLTGRKTSDELPSPRAVAGNEVIDVLDLPLTAEDITRYEGTYVLELGERTLELRVFGEDGQLRAQAAGQSVTRLRAQGDHVFIPDFDDAVRLVFTVENGRASSVTLHQGGGTFTGRRQP